MNTPAHVIFSLSLLSNTNAAKYALAISAGAIMPDVLMVLFYGYQKLQGVPESIIWGERYFLSGWQNAFDLTNSIPILFILSFVSWVAGRKWLSLMFASMVIHCLLDLPVHHDDGHRHFFPFLDFRFESPLSYWDPSHYGSIVSKVEAFFVFLGAIYLWRIESNVLSGVLSMSKLRVVVLLVLAIYALFYFFVVTMWANA